MALTNDGAPWTAWQARPLRSPAGFSPGFEPPRWRAQLPNNPVKVPLYQRRRQRPRPRRGFALLAPARQVLFPGAQHLPGQVPRQPELEMGQQHHLPPVPFVHLLRRLIRGGQQVLLHKALAVLLVEALYVRFVDLLQA